MNARAINIPWDSLIQEATPTSDYDDCFEISFIARKDVNCSDVVYHSFGSFSKGWIDYLVRLRNFLVKPFDIKTSEEEKVNFDFNKPIEKGERVDFFEVANTSENEVLLYGEDMHLEAYLAISIEKHKKLTTIRFATTVNLRNTFGKVYLFVIKPFYKLIVKSMLKNTAKLYI